MRMRTKIVAMILVIALALSLVGCGSSGGSSDGKVSLTFQIWDVAQKAGMEAMCAAYSEKNPNVTIEVQVTSWNEYWTKLEAAATSNQMPDIFWMHTNELLKYADNGILADCTVRRGNSRVRFKHTSTIYVNFATSGVVGVVA